MFDEGLTSAALRPPLVCSWSCPRHRRPFCPIRVQQAVTRELNSTRPICKNLNLKFLFIYSLIRGAAMGHWKCEIRALWGEYGSKKDGALVIIQQIKKEMLL